MNHNFGWFYSETESILLAILMMNTNDFAVFIGICSLPPSHLGNEKLRREIL